MSRKEVPRSGLLKAALAGKIPNADRGRAAGYPVPEVGIHRGRVHLTLWRVAEYSMVDKDPVDCWTFGRVTLLGDAAHPMYPRGSNGAAQAILDARARADCLAAGGDPLAALSAYEAARSEPTVRLRPGARDVALGAGPPQFAGWRGSR